MIFGQKEPSGYLCGGWHLFLEPLLHRQGFRLACKAVLRTSWASLYSSEVWEFSIRRAKPHFWKTYHKYLKQTPGGNKTIQQIFIFPLLFLFQYNHSKSVCVCISENIEMSEDIKASYQAKHSAVPPVLTGKWLDKKQRDKVIKLFNE